MQGISYLTFWLTSATTGCSFLLTHAAAAARALLADHELVSVRVERVEDLTVT